MPIFEPAVTNKPQSSGLGLAIVREIVRQHKGTVSYTTQRGKGTTFHLKFPIQADAKPSKRRHLPDRVLSAMKMKTRTELISCGLQSKLVD